MKLKEYVLLFFITIFSLSIYAQESNNNEVWIEDTTKGDTQYMSHPDYVKNKKRFEDVNRELEKVLTDQSVFYSENIYHPWYIYNNSRSSKERLQRFITDAENHRKNLVSNSLFKKLCSERNSLIPKVRPDAKTDRCKDLLDRDLSSIDYTISQARALIADMESNESEKEENIDNSNTNNSYSNTNNSSSIADSDGYNEYSPSNSTTGSSMSAADLHYKNALERQQAYQQGMQAAADQLVDVGVSIVNDIQQARIRNVAAKNRYVSEYLSEMIPLDKECAVLYANSNYEAFLIKEQELRKYENYAIDDLNWLIEKEGDSKYKNLKYEIATNQKKRVKLILEHNTNQLLKNQKGLRNGEFIKEFEDLQAKEIIEFTGNLATKHGFYNYFEDYNENRSFFYDWAKFIDIERQVRTRRVLEANKSGAILSPLWEAILYLINNYSDPHYDTKTVAEFLKQNENNKYAMLIRTLQKLGKKEIWYQNNTRLKYVYDDTKLKLLLGDGTEPIYYYDVSQLVKKQKSTPLYKFLNDRDWNYVTNHKDTEANKLVKQWVKRDEKLTGKKASNIFEDFLNKNQYIKATRIEIVELIEKEDYDNALSLIIEARMKYPDNYDLLADEANIYFKKGNTNKFLELLKEGIILKPNEPELYYNIGVLRAETGNIEEANNAYRKALAIKADYHNALLNFSSLAEENGYIEEAISYYEKALDVDPENYDLNYELGEIYLNEANKKTREANEILKNKGDFDMYKEVYLARFKYFKGALVCYKIVLKTDDSDDVLKEQVLTLQKTVDKLNARLKGAKSKNEKQSVPSESTNTSVGK